MAAKQKRLRAPSTRSGFTAVLETMEQQNRVTMEALTGLRAEMTRRFDALEAAVLDLGYRVKALEIRLSTLEFMVKQNTDELARLKAEIAHLAEVARGKVEARDVAALAERVARLEARVGL